MSENLVIVESPAKAKTIEKFLGENFLVMSSYGHIRDLSKKNFGVDIANGYEPEYIISDDKKKVVSELKKMAKEAKVVWLASDEDREGEAISWHLFDTLKLKESNTRRIVFNEITKPAILHAIANPRKINSQLVDAQQARRILDRLVGFELSPVLWKKVKPSLSAGRVQSVAVRLLVEREREIMNFKAEASFRVVAVFEYLNQKGKKEQFKAVLKQKIKTKENAQSYLELCAKFSFSVSDLQKKPVKKQPAPPFTTSTLQQEASRKLGFSVAQTMSIAQKLYEAGKITYMRTDSVNLSETAKAGIRTAIETEFGANYYKARDFKTNTKGAQEAHEAIRPTYPDKQTVSGTDTEKKLYDLIWKRAVASQMADAQLERTQITIPGPESSTFIAQGEVIKFDGFLRLYIESTDEDDESDESTILPAVPIGQQLDASQIVATERFSHHPPRYTEASLVKKLEELGIGRPSTYASTISTVQNRGYVVREDKDGVVREYLELSLNKGAIVSKTKTENTGAEKKKMFPTDIGMIVTDFLVKHFTEIMDYHFTAKVEEQFDDIANGGLQWKQMIDHFYKPFHQTVEKTIETSSRERGERILGVDPLSGFTVSVRIGRYGPLAQLGSGEEVEKPQFASLLKGQHIETISLEEALTLFKLPRKLGEYEGKVVTTSIGRFGPYVSHNAKFVSLKKDVDDPYTITLERAIELIEEKKVADENKLIKQFAEDKDLQILNGRWGPYIKFKKDNFKIAKTTDPLSLTFAQCMEIVQNTDKKPTKTTKSRTKK